MHRVVLQCEGIIWQTQNAASFAKPLSSQHIGTPILQSDHQSEPRSWSYVTTVRMLTLRKALLSRLPCRVTHDSAGLFDNIIGLVVACTADTPSVTSQLIQHPSHDRVHSSTIIQSARHIQNRPELPPLQRPNSHVRDRDDAESTIRVHGGKGNPGPSHTELTELGQRDQMGFCSCPNVDGMAKAIPSADAPLRSGLASGLPRSED